MEYHFVMMLSFFRQQPKPTTVRSGRFTMPVDVFILSFAIYGLFSIKRDNTAIAKLK